MKFKGSFRQSLTLQFVVVAVLPILLLGVFGTQYFKSKHIDTVFHLLDSHAVDVSHEASEFLQYTSGNLGLIAKTLDSGLLAGDEEINGYLQMAVDESGSFESIFLLDDHSRVTHLGLSRVVSNRADYLDLDLSSHAIFAQKSRLTGKVWSDTFLSAVTAEPSVTVGIPLGNGTLIGTVSLQILSVELTERLEKSDPSLHFSLLDHRGGLIADSRSGVISQRLNLRNHWELRKALEQNVESARAINKDNSLIESVRLVPETGWVAYASMPVAVALQGVAPLRFLLVTSLALAAVLGIFLSLWLSKRLLQPVLLLRDAVGEVARGNYSQILQPAYYEELEALSSSFREMVSAVEERELSLSESQARYRDLVDSIDGIVWEIDLNDSCFTFVSEHAYQILGYPARQWLEEKNFWLEHTHEDDRDWILSFYEKETKAQHDYDFEYRMIAADERVVWMKCVASAVVEEDRPTRLRGVMLDVTKRKEAELYLQETTLRLQLLISQMPFGCITWDAEKKIEHWNPAAEEIFGFKSQEVFGLHLSDFLALKNPSLYPEGFEKDDLLSQNIVTEMLIRDDRSVTCEWHNIHLKNSDGDPYKVISLVQDVTERVDAENAIKESEAGFRTVFETNPDAVLISCLSDGKILSVNDFCATMSGYSREEMIGNTSVDLGLWVDLAERDRYLALIRENGTVENFEMRLQIKSGRERIGLASARLLPFNDEECLLTVIRDITTMKEAEARMVRSEDRFRSLVTVMGEGLIILGFNGEVVQCNQAAERIMKMEAEEAIGKLHDELMYNAVREDGSLLPSDEYPSMITLQTGKPVVNQIVGISDKEDRIIWLQVNTHALGLGMDGKPVAVVISFADVSGLKQIESELRESERHLQSISRQFEGVLEAIPDRILILDREMRVVWLNWPEELLDPDQRPVPQDVRCYQLPGVNCGPVADKTSPLCDDCPVKKTFESGRTEIVQKDLSDGRIISLRTFPVFSEEGVVVNVIEIAQDITASLLQQTQAARAGQLAALGELAAGVAHEINNPINGVINYAQLILNKAAADSREQELSQRIINESERIATIIRELLYFAREESHEVDCITVMHAINEALALIQHQLYKDGIDLQLEFLDDLPMVQSSSHQIPRLFLNLITNARHALNEKYPADDPNKVLLVRGQTMQKEQGQFVQVSVKDYGVGIPEELLSRVMNPFVTTKTSAEGTGLGLSISHEIVQKHGGTLSIDSVHNEYTEVIVELPVIE